MCTLLDGLATAIWDLETLLDLASRVHQTPFVLPLLFLSIELDFPWLVEGLEPVSSVS